MNLRLGSTGDHVRELERRLQGLGLYTGAIDGVFGGGVESAVKRFQKSNGLEPDGVVGPNTWAALFPAAPPPVSPLAHRPVAERCLALTGAFETSMAFPDCYGGLTGDFDGQGISYGVLQWNIGQGTVQPLFADMLAAHQSVIENIFHDHLDALTNMLAAPRKAQLAWARSIQDPNSHRVFEPWKGLLEALGRTAEFQAVETAHAERIHQDALALCRSYQVSTERALALLFDICVQNGSIKATTESDIRGDFKLLPASLDPMAMEVARLRIIANRRADDALKKYREDVRTRKLTIANGEGVVHQVQYHLEEQFGIRLQPITAENL